MFDILFNQNLYRFWKSSKWDAIVTRIMENGPFVYMKERKREREGGGATMAL